MPRAWTTLGPAWETASLAELAYLTLLAKGSAVGELAAGFEVVGARRYSNVMAEEDYVLSFRHLGERHPAVPGNELNAPRFVAPRCGSLRQLLLWHGCGAVDGAGLAQGGAGPGHADSPNHSWVWPRECVGGTPVVGRQTRTATRLAGTLRLGGEPCEARPVCGPCGAPAWSGPRAARGVPCAQVMLVRTALGPSAATAMASNAGHESALDGDDVFIFDARNLLPAYVLLLVPAPVSPAAAATAAAAAAAAAAATAAGGGGGMAGGGGGGPSGRAGRRRRCRRRRRRRRRRDRGGARGAAGRPPQSLVPVVSSRRKQPGAHLLARRASGARRLGHRGGHRPFAVARSGGGGQPVHERCRAARAPRAGGSARRPAGTGGAPVG